MLIASALLCSPCCSYGHILFTAQICTVQICPYKYEAGCLLWFQTGLGHLSWVFFRKLRRTVLMSALPYPLGALSKGAVTLWTHKTARITHLHSLRITVAD